MLMCGVDDVDDAVMLMCELRAMMLVW